MSAGANATEQPQAQATVHLLALPASVRVLATTTLSACCLLSLIANCVTCHVILHSRRLQSTTNYFIIALSAPAMLSGISLCLSLVSLARGGWTLGDVACRLAGVYFHWLLVANVYLLVSILVDRFYAIVQPLSFKISRSKAKKMILASYVAGLLASLPMAAYHSELASAPGRPGVCGLGRQLAGDWHQLAGYAVAFGLVAVVAPAAVGCCIFWRVWAHIWTINRTRGSIRGRVLQRTTNQVPRTKIKIFKLIAAVCLLDAVTMCAVLATEFGFLAFVAGGGAAYDPLTLCSVLYFLDGFGKPVLYVSLNSNFRRGCHEVLCWSQFRCYRQELYTVTSVSVFGKKNYVTAVDVNGVTENRWENPSIFEVGNSKSSPAVRRSNAI